MVLRADRHSCAVLVVSTLAVLVIFQNSWAECNPIRLQPGISEGRQASGTSAAKSCVTPAQSTGSSSSPLSPNVGALQLLASAIGDPLRAVIPAPEVKPGTRSESGGGEGGRTKSPNPTGPQSSGHQMSFVDTPVGGGGILPPFVRHPYGQGAVLPVLQPGNPPVRIQSVRVNNAHVAIPVVPGALNPNDPPDNGAPREWGFGRRLVKALRYILLILVLFGAVTLGFQNTKLSLGAFVVAALLLLILMCLRIGRGRPRPRPLT